ncbi:hypothetical protein DID88_004514 [Monilinia fructigena]|uniref:EKC/KEOPS complex subunit BUD32 n=1 Tax=Monilinia fructigena TaxID=38457 RepID=A0A395IRB6_9HELO|nr:hypothetical protein DID88_004514 [Monilinia fructigena]
MIEPQERFWSEGQKYFGSPDNPKTKFQCNIWDWDQLRIIKIKGTANLFTSDEYKEIPILAQFADYLSPEIRAVEIDDDGRICGVSKELGEDESWFVPYPPFSIAKSLAGCRTVKHSQLKELDRLGLFVDVASYEDEYQNLRTVAFKFNVLGKPLRLKMAWDEINIVKSLPLHPNIVPFDSVIIEDVESRVIGFTTKYIPGGTLSDPKKPFRFEWLQQLTQLVDFLNLHMGIMHQDIAPRNLLIDPDTHKLLLFDFDRAACGTRNLQHGRDDVTAVAFTLYELITNDTHLTSIPYWERDIEIVQSLKEWSRNRELDREVCVFRDFLNAWIQKRQSDNAMDEYLNAPNRPSWPELPNAHDYDVPYEHGKTAEGEIIWRTGRRLTRSAVKAGQYCFQWQRPPQSRLLRKPFDDNGVGKVGRD